MKKILFIVFIALLLIPFSLTSNAAGATLSISTSKTTYQVGDIFSLPISINSGGNQIQVVRAKISYPADLLQAQGIVLGNLFPQKSPGGSIGNGLIYEGGYRLGDSTSENGLLGTASFKVLKEGTATISLVSGSRIITSEPLDIYSGGNSINITLGTITPEHEDEGTKEDETKPQEKKTTTILAAPSVSSSTHPQNIWTNKTTVKLSWGQTAGNLGYILKLDKEPLSDIGTIITTKQNHYTSNNLTDGIWYFHIKAKYDLRYSKIVYYPIKIDTTPPEQPEPNLSGEINPLGDNIYKLFFNTLDSLSGIDYYEIKFNNGQFKKANSPYSLNSQEIKANLLTVKAIDKAGNVTDKTINLADQITQIEDDFLKAEQAKTTLFDIQAEATQRSWSEFYLVLAIIAIIFAGILIYILVKKRR